MKAVISHASALEYWRTVSTLRLPQPSPSRALMPGERLPNDEAARLRAQHGLTSPVHVLVSKHQRCSDTAHVTFHTRNDPLPLGSLARIEKDVFVVMPEYVIVQAAVEASFPQLVDLCYEFCGTYTPSANPSPKDFNQRPETSIQKIESYLSRASSLHGVRLARRAIRYALPGSASVAETTLSMLFTLPYMNGGCSLSRPKLNYRIDPGCRARRNVSQDYYKCDLFWEKASLAVEYESNLCHTGAERIAKDSQRRDELAGMGVTVVTITARQLFNLQAFNKAAQTIAQLLGERIQPRNEHFTQRQLELRSILLAKFSQRNPGPYL